MMKVEPELPNHPKYLRLKRAVGPLAMEYIIRMWGHCECNKRGEWWPEADGAYLEAVCGWSGRPGKLFASLLELKWISQEEGGIRIHDWDQTNWRAVTNWDLGSRPKRHAPAKAKPRLNQGPSPLNEGMSELSEGGGLPLSGAPGRDEVAAWALEVGVDPEWAESKRAATDETHGWWKNGKVIDWRARWKRWWDEDKKTPGAPAADNAALLARMMATCQ